jgi:hypothetical protein
MDRLIKWLNLLLVADVFFVIAAALWLAIAVVGHEAKIPLGLDLWYILWEPVFTPAIGILMAGALVSGAIGWVRNKLDARAATRSFEDF